MKGKKKSRKLLIVIVSVLIVPCAIYVSDYYEANDAEIDSFLLMSEVGYDELDDGSIVFEPSSAKVGVIFYQGGKVENDAYKPLMAALACRGVMCVLVEMPFNLAVFGINSADGIQECYPQIERWYIGGHSLGGSMAASYLADHTDKYEGLILLGSYSTADLSDTSLDVLSVYGSEDRVLNMGKYEQNKSNLPADFMEIVIDGGCHAYFGMYGAQDGDGVPTITNEEQINLTADAVCDFIG